MGVWVREWGSRDRPQKVYTEVRPEVACEFQGRGKQEWRLRFEPGNTGVGGTLGGGIPRCLRIWVGGRCPRICRGGPCPCGMSSDV